mgnify:CR=1 FL=1
MVIRVVTGTVVVVAVELVHVVTCFTGDVMLAEDACAAITAAVFRVPYQGFQRCPSGDYHSCVNVALFEGFLHDPSVGFVYVRYFKDVLRLRGVSWRVPPACVLYS